jgi:O-antigen/teichoic acid export membrane protein
MMKLRRSLALSAAQNYISVALQLVSTMVLSRVLTPTEVGVFAVAAVFAALATNFRDFGIAEYLIQAKHLTPQNIRAAFSVNIGTSWSMGLVMFFGAGFVGDFYHSPVVADVMRVQAISFLLIPFGAINQAWFRREMRFEPLFAAGVAADLVSLSLAITLALNDYGAMSLAWSGLAGIATTVAVSLYFRPKDFPRWPGLRGLGEVLKFGAFASGIYVLGQLGRGAPEMIIGRVQGVTDVAIFSRAGGLVQLFRQLVVRAVMPVCLPYFAKAVRDEGSVHRAYMRGVAIFTAIGWVFLGFLAMAAFPSIRLIYGDQWAAAVPLAGILCVAGAVELVHYLAKEALISQGRVKLATRLQFVLQLVQLLGLCAVIPFGLIGASWGILASSVCGLALSQWHLRVGTAFTVGQLWASCRTSLAVTAFSLAPMTVIFSFVPATEGNYLRYLFLGGSLTAVCWLLALRYTRHPLWAELDDAAGPLLRRLSAWISRKPHA